MAGSRVGDVVAAAVTALQGDADLATRLGGTATVYTHVEQGTDPPYVAVLGGDEQPWAITFQQVMDVTSDDDGDNGGRTVDVLCQCVSTYRGTKEVDSIADRVIEVLTSAATWSGVVDFQLAELIRNTALIPTDLFVVGTLWFQRQVVIRVTVG